MKDARIQKILSERGICSRRAAEKMMVEGRVKINGRGVKLGDKMDMRKDLLSIDGKNIHMERTQELHYIMVYKPRGYISTMSDERGRKTVKELVSDIPARVFPIGRLDKDSEGLLLFTNDGDFANVMMHPSHGIKKLYRVTVRPHATEEQIIALSEGVKLDDGDETAPAVVRVVADAAERTVLELTISEGKNRQIRRMCEAVGLNVIRLKRSGEGPVKLGMLAPGKHRELTNQEVESLKASSLKAARKEVTETAQKRAEKYGSKQTIRIKRKK